MTRSVAQPFWRARRAQRTLSLTETPFRFPLHLIAYMKCHKCPNSVILCFVTTQERAKENASATIGFLLNNTPRQAQEARGQQSRRATLIVFVVMVRKGHVLQEINI